MRFSRSGLGSLNESGPQDKDTILRSDKAFGGRVTFNTKGYYGFEAGLLRSDGKITTQIRTSGQPAENRVSGVKVHTAFVNFISYMMPSGERWRPFLTGGMQAYDYGKAVFGDLRVEKARHYGANYGGGVKINVFPHGLLRIDARHSLGGRPYGLTFRDATKADKLFQQIELTAGFSITFGGAN